MALRYYGFQDFYFKGNTESNKCLKIDFLFILPPSLSLGFSESIEMQYNTYNFLQKVI